MLPARTLVAGTTTIPITNWAKTGASISVNGRRVQTPATPGSFAAIHRQWNTGDRVELNLPMTMRL
ncbi:MAG: glycoside hydrolase family 127 protein, partial [Acidobacteriia bacterium]|nr:glycoside hydrolase family 127 protein [Terriglobia bacterium]